MDKNLMTLGNLIVGVPQLSEKATYERDFVCLEPTHNTPRAVDKCYRASEFLKWTINTIIYPFYLA